jgi:hypothetical protein
MGLDFDFFVHPERISPQLICPICTQVLQNPVQTSSEHLFCEEELLEWMTRSSLCPVTKSELDPSSIRKPGRVILNMLAELEMYCSNKPNGCKWVGQNEHLKTHLSSCQFRCSEDLNKELTEKNNEIQSLIDRIDSLETRNEELLEENSGLRNQLFESEKKLRIYDAFLLQTDSGKVNSKHSPSKPHQSSASNASDIDRLSRLRTLHSLKDSSSTPEEEKRQRNEEEAQQHHSRRDHK